MYQLIDKFFIILMNALVSSDGTTVRRFSPIFFSLQEKWNRFMLMKTSDIMYIKASLFRLTGKLKFGTLWLSVCRTNERIPVHSEFPATMLIYMNTYVIIQSYKTHEHFLLIIKICFDKNSNFITCSCCISAQTPNLGFRIHNVFILIAIHYKLINKILFYRYNSYIYNYTIV